MKEVIKSKVFLLAALIAIALSAFSFVAYTHARAVCSEASDCCKSQPEGSSEMLWDVLSHQFVSTVLAR